MVTLPSSAIGFGIAASVLIPVLLQGKLRRALYQPDAMAASGLVVTDGNRMLVVKDPSDRYIMPVGRLEPNDTPEYAE